MQLSKARVYQSVFIYTLTQISNNKKGSIMKKFLLFSLATVASFNINAATAPTISFHLGDTGFESGVFSIVKDGIVYGSVNVHTGFDSFLKIDPYSYPNQGNDYFSVCFSGRTPAEDLLGLKKLTTEELCNCQTAKTYQLTSNQSVMLDRSTVEGDWRGYGCIYQM